MTTRPLDQLTPESRAVLSLVLLQSRSYADIADLLRLEPSEVRDRAHIAAEQLIEPAEELGPEIRASVIDYLLGEQTVSERAETRSGLVASEPARRWATELTAALAPLAKMPLPAIPAGDPPAPAGVVPAPFAPPPEAAVAPAPATDPVPGRRFVTTSAHTASPAPESPEPRTRRTPLVIAGLVAVAAVVILIVVLSGSSSARHVGSTGRSGQHLSTLVLKPAGADHNALGAGDVIRQKSGTLLLQLQAHGLAPNSDRDSYAVWLFNTPGDARLLGFVSPGVGAAGTFSSGVTLPDDAVRFHSLIVTLERSSQPTTPGPTVLRSPLSLG